MQPDRFTIKSQEAVAAAQRLAAASRNPEVAPEHLLSALLEQDDGFVPAALRKLSADVTAITDRARAAVSELPAVSGEEVPETRPSQAFISTLQRAEKEMAANGDQYICAGTCSSRSPIRRPRPQSCSPTATRLPAAVAEIHGPATGHFARTPRRPRRRSSTSAAT